MIEIYYSTISPYGEIAIKYIYICDSVTPSSTTSSTMKVRCMGKTKSRLRCRNYASPGQNYCYSHATGTSIMGDSMEFE